MQLKHLPTFFLCLCSIFSQNAFAQQNYAIHFDKKTVLLEANFEQITSQKLQIEENEIFENQCFRLLQFAQIPTENERKTLENLGIVFYHYVHFGAYLVAIPQDFDLQNLKNFKPRSISKIENAWKMSPKLAERPFPVHAVWGEEIEVIIQTYKGISFETAAAAFLKNDIPITEIGNYNGYFRAFVKEDLLEKIAALPFVSWVELVGEPGIPEDLGGRSLHRANLLDSEHAAGLHFDGFGVGVLCRDDGVVGPHIDFQGRMTNLASLNLGQTHGDGVSGIMAGAGNLNPVNKGMAAGSELFVVDYISSFQDNTLQLHLDEGVKITNSSYSDGCNAGYTTGTQTVDRQLFENETLMHVFSAGNSNQLNCGYGADENWGNITGGHKQAKNCIATANLYANGDLEISSSRGPHDGRLKPDISAHGQNQISNAENNTYQTFGGTSGAAPGIAGCLAQLFQAYKETHNGEEPKTALLKTAIMNTANEMGVEGPDFQYGWGHINAFRAYQLLAENNYSVGQIDQSENQESNLQVPENVSLMKIMLYWHEQESFEGSAKALINDLDLELVNENGQVFFPYKLNPTPNAQTLGLPAGFGRDSLNNVEQVAFKNPPAGTYTIRVKGTEIPFGAQPYFIAWDFLKNDLKLTYPNGGEGLVPNENEWIRWETPDTTGNFVLRYSLDAGQNWQTMTTLNGHARMYEWKVPVTLTGSAKVMIENGANTDQSDTTFSIGRLVSGLSFVKICPDTFWVKWNKIGDTLSYNVYLLGQKYMEVVGRTDEDVFGIPTQYDGRAKWAAVGILDPEQPELKARRTNAVSYNGPLLNCPQPFDMSASALVEPLAANLIRCAPGTQNIGLVVQNAGPNDISGATVSYQLNGNAPVTEVLTDLAAFASVEHFFQTPLILDFQGLADLKIWTDFPDDNFHFNDTIRRTYSVVTGTTALPLNQNFQNATFPPNGWAIDNPDQNITWARRNAGTGPTGNNTQTTFLNCFNYLARGEVDYLYLPPMDLSQLTAPALLFDLSHARVTTQRSERLILEVFANCDLNATPVIIYDKNDPDLATTNISQQQFFPNSVGDWRTEWVDLIQFAGQNVIIRIKAINDNGNNIFLDNIRVENSQVAPPFAGFEISQTTICRGDTVVYTSTSTGDFLTYKWTFGTQANPASAFTAGPHTVIYPTPGAKSVRLIVTNPLGSDTISELKQVLTPPFANFTMSGNGLGTFTFTNTSNNSTTYLWSFGDGTTSSETSPTHIYTEIGTYIITLTSMNACGSVTKTLELTVTTVGVKDLVEGASVEISPNPTEGEFKILINYPTNTEGQISVFDALGKLIFNSQTPVKQGLSVLEMPDLNLPEGIYQVRVFIEGGLRSLNLVVL